ncbi:MAG: SH3 domain-containing protein [Anaerolineales bacterium]|nr:SH3 domain-containing protein [Anaerolineales bacterium]
MAKNTDSTGATAFPNALVIWVILLLVACAPTAKVTPTEAEPGAPTASREPTSTAVPQQTPERTVTSPAAVTEPPGGLNGAGLNEAGPWLLFCASIQGEIRTVLGDLDGSGFERLDREGCLDVTHLSPSGRKAAVFQGTTLQIVRFPNGEVTHEVELPGTLPDQMVSDTLWSPDGKTIALPLHVPRSPPVLWEEMPTDLFLYHLEDQELRLRFEDPQELVDCDPAPCTQTSHAGIDFLGWAPNGEWLLVQDTASEFRFGRGMRPAYAQPISFSENEQTDSIGLYGLSVEGGVAHRLTETHQQLPIQVLGWTSESTVFTFHGPDLEHQSFGSYELYRHQLPGGTSQLISADVYPMHAFDPVSGVLLTYRSAFGDAGHSAPSELTKMSASAGWRPRQLDPGPGGLWELRWAPELQAVFAIRSLSGSDEIRIELLDLDAQTMMSVPAEMLDRTAREGFFPAPTGEFLLINGDRFEGESKDEGMLLISRAGEITKRYPASAQAVVWHPNGTAFYLLRRDGEGLYQASAAGDWQLQKLAVLEYAESPLGLVRPLERMVGRPCPEAPDSRLDVGDHAVVNDEPRLPTRVRSDPSLEGEVIGRLEVGARLDVMAGPRCGDGFVWWYISARRGQIIGWVAEGDRQGPWLIRQ